MSPKEIRSMFQLVPILKPTQSDKNGFTIIELLVSVVIIGILGALVFVAIDSVRGQARRTVCQSRLVQIGKAALSFEEANQHFPTGLWQDELLPYLEIQMTDRHLSLDCDASVFSCPSDDSPHHVGDRLYGNYLFCYGTWLDDSYQSTGLISSYSNTNSRPIKYADIRDGTSTTAMASETLVGGTEFQGVKSRLRTIWNTPGSGYTLQEKDLLAAACKSIPSNPEAAGWLGNVSVKSSLFVNTGHGYFVSTTGLGANLYNHILPPQHPSCSNAGDVESGISTTTSNHGGVVTVVYCDGHVAPVTSDIDWVVWQKQGTKND